MGEKPKHACVLSSADEAEELCPLAEKIRRWNNSCLHFYVSLLTLLNHSSFRSVSFKELPHIPFISWSSPWPFQALCLSGLALAPTSSFWAVRYFCPPCLNLLQKACRNLFWPRILAFHDSRSFLFWVEQAWYNNLPLSLVWKIRDTALTTYGSLYSHWCSHFIELSRIIKLFAESPDYHTGGQGFPLGIC